MDRLCCKSLLMGLRPGFERRIARLFSSPGVYAWGKRATLSAEPSLLGFSKAS